KEAQGCAAALAIPGVLALAVAAFVSPSPVNGICRMVLGLGLIAINKPVAESDLDTVYFAGIRIPLRRGPHPSWYSPYRLALVAGGLFLVISGAAAILNG